MTSEKNKRMHVHNGKTTHHSDKQHETVKVDGRLIRLSENEKYLKNTNIKAFLDMIAWAEGGDYDLKYGGVKGKKNDKWRITDYSTHPGPGSDKKTTAAGRYQINKMNWQENGVKRMGLTDFSPHTQDLIAIEGLRQGKIIDAIISGDMPTSIKGASTTWNALAQGHGLPNRVAGQPYKNTRI